MANDPMHWCKIKTVMMTNGSDELSLRLSPCLSVFETVDTIRALVPTYELACSECSFDTNLLHDFSHGHDLQRVSRAVMGWPGCRDGVFLRAAPKARLSLSVLSAAPITPERYPIQNELC